MIYYTLPEKAALHLSKTFAGARQIRQMTSNDCYLVFAFLGVFNFDFTWCLSRFSSLWCWLGRADANTARCTSEEDFARNK